MSLSTHDDYLPTLDLFLASWALADGAVPGGPGGPLIVVLDGVGRPEVVALRAELAAKRDEVRHVDLLRRLGVARGRLNRGALHGWLGLFNEAARAWWGDRPEGRAVPEKPLITASLEKFLRPVREALRLWDRLNGGPPVPGVALPLTVGGEGAFGAGEMRALYNEALALREEVEEAEFMLSILRAERDVLEGRVRAVLSAYLKAVPARLGRDHAVVRALPRLWPLPGRTPDAVSAEGAWDGAEGAARVTWEASADGALSHYEVRWCPGRVYDKKEERVAGRVGRAGPRVFMAREGLESPGDEVCFRVYVVLETDNERGSGTVVVRRADE
jgi:hypothetical protein